MQAMKAALPAKSLRRQRHMDQYYLIGSPVAHSLSPAMMNLAFKELGIDAHYGLAEADEKQLPSVVERFLKKGVSGWNVTMPDKKAMMKLCDELSVAARIGGSVNTVKNVNGRLYGYTTDGQGFTDALNRAGVPVGGRKLALLGTGGAAASILIQSALDGAREIAVFYHREASAERIRFIAEKLRAESRTRIHIYSISDPEVLRSEIRSSDILCNATSIGMRTDTEKAADSDCLIPDLAYLHDSLFVYDIIYHPLKTPLLILAEKAGLKAQNGLSMLLGQGAAAFSIWTGKVMPYDTVWQTVFRNL